jgi:hypothetical protein
MPEHVEWDWPPEPAARPRRYPPPAKRTSPRPRFNRANTIYYDVDAVPRRRVLWWNTRIASIIADTVLGFGIFVWKTIILCVLGVVLVGCLWLLSVLLMALANGPPPHHGTLG